MTTKNIKTDYGAAGDGQIQNLTVSFTSGNANLTVFSNTFSSADIGKSIAIQDWIPIPGDGTHVEGAILCVIGSVSSFSGGSQTLGLDQNALRTFSSVVKQVEWGTNDTTPFANWRTDFQGQTGVVLTMPSGRYCGAGTGSTIPLGQGIPDLVVNGVGNPVLTDMLNAGSGFNLGGTGSLFFSDNTHEYFVSTVSAGSTIIPMVTAADAANFTVSNWAWISGYDTQGFGFPPNPFFSEFVQITAVDSVAGTLTISSPLKNGYESAWPQWGFGDSGTPSLGGPGKIYQIKQNWDCKHVYNGFGVKTTDTLYNMNGRDMTMNNCFSELWPVNISCQNSCVINNHGTVVTGWELDKLSQTVVISDTTAHAFTVQSSSPYDLTFNNVTVTGFMDGTGQHFTANNCTFPDQVGFQPTSYGTSKSVTINNCTFAGQTTIGGVKETDLIGAGYTMSGGIITRAKSAGTGAPPQWAIPGQYFSFGSRYDYENPVCKVIDITHDATNLYIQTDQSGGFPSPVSPATTISAISASVPTVTFVGSSGCDDANSWSNVNANIPLYSRWKLTYVGNIGSSNPIHQIKISGQAVSIKMTVNAGYTAGTFNLDGPTVVAKPGNTQATWNPIIDLTTPGVRIITPSGVTGTAGTDSGLALPNSGNVWLVDNQLTAAMSGATGSGSITLEIIADQGFPSLINISPARFRIH